MRRPGHWLGVAVSGLFVPAVWAQHVLSGGLSTQLSLPSAVTPAPATAAATGPAGDARAPEAPPMRVSVKLGAALAVTYGGQALAAASTANAPQETMAQFAPNLRVAVRGPVLNGQLDYTANALAFSHSTDDNTVFHTLRSNARLSLWQDRFGIDAAAQYTQQALSAFGNPLVGLGSSAVAVNPLNGTNRNAVDVVALQIAPVVRGRLLNTVDVETRYTRSHLENRTVGGGAQDAQALQTSLAGGDRVRWAVQGQVQRQEFPLQRTLDGSRVLASLTIPVGTEVALKLGAGGERQNLLASASNPDEQRSSRLLQMGATWSPGPRTSASVEGTDRFFGSAWQAAFSHRFDRLGIRLAASRNLTDGGLSATSVNTSNREGASFTAADLYGQLLGVVETDAARRDAMVSQLLRARGIDADARVVGLSQSLGPVLQDRLELGVAYVLPRQTFNLIAVRSASERILRDPIDPSEDIARFGGVVQTIVQAGLSHRLSPDATLAVSLGQLRSEAQTGIKPVLLNQAELNGTFRVGQRLSVGLVLREADIQNPNASMLFPGTLAQRRNTSLTLLLIPQF